MLADGPADAPTNRPAIKATWKRETVALPVPSNRLTLTMGTNQFAFVLPADFQLVKDPSGEKVILPRLNSHCSLTFSLLPRVATNAPGPLTSAELGERRADWLAQHPQAEIVNEYARGLGKGIGQGFTFRWSSPARQRELQGVLYAPYADRLLEITFQATEQYFQEAVMVFEVLTATFSASENGRLEIHPLSDKL